MNDTAMYDCCQGAYGKALALLTALEQREEFYAIVAAAA